MASPEPIAASAVAVCIPTAGRPSLVEAVLGSLAEQDLQPIAILVLDASHDEGTEKVCRRVERRFLSGVLRHVRCERSLTRQRRRGIELLSDDFRVDHVCMLDDDVTLAPDFLSQGVAFLTSEAGRAYGGISGYDMVWWGRSFERKDRLYARLGIYEGELRPGRWLYCGKFLELSRLALLDGVHDVDFIGGGLTIWRKEVFEHFLPPTVMDGYALLEDKHLSLRVGSRYKLGVLGSAKVRHERAGGGRPKRVSMASARVRREALLLRDCDPTPSLRRYIAFLAVTLLDLLVLAMTMLRSPSVASLQRLIGSLGGLFSCLIWPPRRSNDALSKPSRSRTRAPALNAAPAEADEG